MAKAEAVEFRVLQARPAESEAKLSYAALADLVGAAFDETRGELPEPQQRAFTLMPCLRATCQMHSLFAPPPETVPRQTSP